MKETIVKTEIANNEGRIKIKVTHTVRNGVHITYFESQKSWVPTLKNGDTLTIEYNLGE